MSHRNSSGRAVSPPRRQRACVPCSRAKARCNFRTENIQVHICDRCTKLGIGCAKKTTESLRKPRQIKPLNSRVSSLEAQLQQLTSSFGDRSSPGAGSVSSAQSDHIGSPPSVETPSSSSLSSLSTAAWQASFPVKPTTAPPAEPPNGLTWREAATILDIYRQELMYRFPCVLINQSTTPQQLLAEKPFTFRAVMLAAAPLSVTRTKKMRRNVMAYLSHRLLVEEKRHLDLLQGLLVTLLWNDSGPNHDSQITVLTYTALGLAHSLGLARPPLGVLQHMGKNRTLDDCFQLKEYATTQAHSLEEMRAFIGLFCLVSLNSTHLGRRNPLDSQYITTCCDNLCHSSSSPHDYYLHRLARTYLLADKLTTLFGSPNDAERSQPYLFLVEGHARRIRTEITAVMESVDFENLQPHQQGWAPEQNSSPDDHKGWQHRKDSFTLHYHYLLVRLYEPATCLQEVAEGEASLYRAVCLRNCLFAAKAYTDVLLHAPPSEYVYVAAAAREHVTSVMTITMRLMFIEAPGWDVRLARATIDVEAVLEALRKRLLEAEAFRRERVVRFARKTSSRSGGDLGKLKEMDKEGGSHLIAGADKVRCLREWYVRKIKAGEEMPWTGGVTTGSSWGVGELEAGLETGAGGPLGAGLSIQPPTVIGLDEGGPGGSNGAFFGELYGPTSWGFEEA